MMRSMFSGVSGLKAHQLRMDVIGNNVANVNTVGFKSSRVTFQEIFNQTMKGSGAPDSATGRGGTNPMQVGLGMSIASVDNIMTRGSVQRTDNPTDLAIDGDGFFVVKGGNADAPKFTRAGNFTIDKQGNLVTSSGLNVQGWQGFTRDASTGQFNFDTEQPLGSINLYSDSINGNKKILGAEATTSALMSGNLNALAVIDTDGVAPGDQWETFVVPMTVYDSLGNDYNINIRFHKDSAYAAGNLAWKWEVDPTGGGLPVNVTKNVNGVPTVVGTVTGNGQVRFNADGSFRDVVAGAPLTITPTAAGPSTTIVTGAAPFAVNLDLTQLTQFSADTSASAKDVNGFPTGNLVSFNVGSDGIITGMYSNGRQRPLGLIALASFENPAGMKKEGENLFSATTNSGDYRNGVRPGSAGVGALSPGTLEMSNVDLSREFTEMITTERGFQANSRIITTSDEMLQDLVNLKR